MSQSVSVAQAVQIAISHYQSGQIAEAERVCKQVLDADPKSLDTLHLLGVISSQTGRHKNAVKYLRQAVKIRDDIPAIHSNLGIAYQAQEMYEEALDAYRRAVALKSDFADALINMGNIHKARGELDDAIDHYKRAIAANPANPLAHYNLGNALASDPAAAAGALAHYKQAVALKPDFAEAHYNLGLLLDEQGLRDDAQAAYLLSLALDPANARALNSLGLSLGGQGRSGEAEACYRRALEIDPGNADFYYNLGLALREQGRVDEAIKAYEEAAARAPDEARYLAELLHQLQHICDWQRVAELEERLLNMVREGAEGISPFTVLTLRTATPADHLMCARTFAKRQEVPASAMFTHEAPRKREGKIRIGYLSCDFHDHATAQLMAELFERHDRERFETTAYSYGPDDGSPMRKRLESAFTHFADIRGLSHAESARKINADGIDILVDLKGYTAGARTQIPAFRPAPVQVNFLGYPGSMGASYIDYIIADGTVIPEGAEGAYSEKIIRLPNCYQPNDTKREIAKTAPARAECGLPGKGFVFCSFNQTYKITPDVFDAWMRLLRAVPDSVLWLLECNKLVKANLQGQAQARGVDPSRLVFAPRVASALHLARHANADLFLDTLPVNAHTTASDALWAGLPVVTCAGDAFAGRVAASLLSAAGLQELVTPSLADYEALALNLAQNPEKLSSLRRKIADTRLQMPLFDIAAFTKNLEDAYLSMIN